MNAEYGYFTETDGKVRFIHDPDDNDKKLAEVGYFLRIRLDLVKKSLRIPVPEEIAGRPVGLIAIIPMLPEGQPVPELDFPLIKHLYIPSGVRHLRILKAITRGSDEPGGITEEKIDLLSGCTVEISPDNPRFCVSGHGIYSRDMTQLFHIFSPGECFEVPSGVKTIRGGAGCALKGLRRLIVPESVTEIRDCAFEGCTDLEEVVIHAEKLGIRAFYGCRSLTSLSMSNIARLYDDTFKGCGTLQTLLRDLIDSCIAIRRIKIDLDKQTEEFELELDCREIAFAKAFRKNRSLKKIALSNAENICELAFCDCGSLSSAVLDCKIIGGRAFQYCKALNSVTFMNTEVIGERAFSSCEALAEVTLPNTLLMIKNNAFLSTGIRRLKVPPSVREIGRDIFGYNDHKNPMLEIYSNDGILPIRRGSCPAESGTLLLIHSAQTDNILYGFAILGDLSTVLTEHGVDFTEYDKIFKENTNSFDYDSQTLFLAAWARLRNPIGMDEETQEFFKDYVADNAELILLLTIDADNTTAGEVAAHPYLELIDDERLLYLIDESAREGKTEITAVLMQKMHERRSRE